MYKVFFDDKKILVTNKLKKSYKKKYRIFLSKSVSVKDFIKKIEGYRYGKFVFYIDKKENYFDDFASFFIQVKAAGGLVRDHKGKILFIKRKGKWDLPKGKLEEGELLEDCALREVQEETDVSPLELLGLRTITYHIYKREHQYYLKETHWYNMYSDYPKELHPQKEEEIEICTWKKPKKLKKLLKNSFSSIHEVFKGEY